MEESYNTGMLYNSVENHKVTKISDAASPQTNLFMKLKFPLYFAPDGLKNKHIMYNRFHFPMGSYLNRN